MPPLIRFREAKQRKKKALYFRRSNQMISRNLLIQGSTNALTSVKMPPGAQQSSLNKRLTKGKIELTAKRIADCRLTIAV